MLILIGPSASGKTEIVKLLIKNHSMEKLVTYTSRTMRIGEVKDKDYHFIEKEDFEERIKNNFFFEYVEYNGNYYGTAKEDLTKNKVVILEKNGLNHYVKHVRNEITIVYLKCQEEVLRQRMIKRGDEEEVIIKRLEGDKIKFDSSIEEVADLIMDTSYTDILEDTEKIYNFYQERLRNENTR